MDVVDFIVGSERDPEIRLVIADHLPWDIEEAEHLWLLQCKINKYLGFIESGEIYEKWPAARGKHLVIDLAPKYPLSDRARNLVVKFQALIRSFGLELRVRQAALAPESEIAIGRGPVGEGLQ